MKSKLFSNEMVRTKTKGQIWIPSFLAIGFFAAFPLCMILKLGEWSKMGYLPEQLLILYENLWKDGLMQSGYIIAIGAGIMNAVNGYWYLYSSRKIDFYHSLPRKRSSFFWEKAVTGMVFYLVPYLFMELIAFVLGAYKGYGSLKTAKSAILMAALHLLLYLMIYFAVVFVICITGNLLMGFLCLCGLFVYGPVLDALWDTYASVFFQSFFSGSSNFRGFFKYASPYVMGKNFLEAYGRGSCHKELLMILGTLVLFGLAAYLAYGKRPSEKTGKPLIYSASQCVIKLMAVVPGALIAGIILAGLPGTELKMVWWIFGIAVTVVLVHGVMEVIYQMDFRAFFSKKLQLVLAGLLTAGICLAFWNDFFGYDRYLPKYEKLQGICIPYTWVTDSVYSGMVTLNQDGKYELEKKSYAGEGDIGYEIANSQELYSLLREMVEQSEQENQKDTAYYSLPMEYRLTSGRRVRRSYRISGEMAGSFLRLMYEDENLKERRYAFLKEIDGKYIDSIVSTFADGSHYWLFQNDNMAQQRFVDALIADIDEADTEALLGTPCGKLTVAYKDIPIPSNANNMIPGRESTDYLGMDIYVYPEFQRTVAILKETGYPMSMEAVPVDEIKINYSPYFKKYYGASFWEDGISEDRAWNQLSQLSYTDEEEIRMLKEAILSEEFAEPWVACEPCIPVMVTCGNEAYSGNEMYAEILKGRLPDFVKKDIEEQWNITIDQEE